jgi:D-amino peptidase
MKAFISIDMEGICGIVREIETDPVKGGEAYQQSRHLMTQEANAAIEGCMKAGATEILIADSHWNFDNLIPEELHEAAILLRGTPRGFSMVEELDASSDAALFVGYHARAGTPRAILDHTYSGTVAAVRVNGTEVGETGINAYLAGHHGVPVVLVTGDRAVTRKRRRSSRTSTRSP